jgi:hypothetical protein
LSLFLRLPQPGGPGPCIYFPQEQGGPVMRPGTGFPFRRLLRLAGLRWRYSIPVVEYVVVYAVVVHVVVYAVVEYVVVCAVIEYVVVYVGVYVVYAVIIYVVVYAVVVAYVVVVYAVLVAVVYSKVKRLLFFTYLYIYLRGGDIYLHYKQYLLHMILCSCFIVLRMAFLALLNELS